MNVLIDGHMLGTNEGGNERYTKNLATSLLKHENKSSIAYFVLTNKEYLNNKSSTILKKDKLIPLSWDDDIYRLLYFIPTLVNKLNIDIVHSNYIAPFYKNSKSVITVHDFSFKYFPNFYSLKDKVIFYALLPYSMSKSDAIIVPSQFTKKEIIKFYPHYNNKIHVIYEAADKNFYSMKKNEAKKLLLKKFKYLNNFILTINSKNPKKNINSIIEAFARVKVKYPDLQLVIVGGNFHIKNFYKNKKDLFILNNVDDQELNLLYNTCKIFLYYSLYEGFGLPLLEAIKCHAPLIASDIEVHREITKNKIMYANLNDLNDLINKVIDLLISPNKINNLIEKSGELNKLYSWDNMAEQTQKVYKHLINNETRNYRH